MFKRSDTLDRFPGDLGATGLHNSLTDGEEAGSVTGVNIISPQTPDCL